MGIYRVEGSPYWQYDFTVQGQRHRGSTETAKRSEAESIFAKRRSEAVLGNFYEQENQISISSAFDRYEEERAQFTASYKSIQAHIDHIVTYFSEAKMLHTIGQAELTMYVAKCREENVVTPATINRRLATFQGMHNDARLVWGAQVQNIDFRKLKLKEPAPVNNTLSKAQFERMKKNVAPYMQVFLMLAVYTGLRKMNILTMKGEQIDMERRIIQTIGKGGKAISVPIVDMLADYIIEHKLHTRKHVINRKGKPIQSIKTTWRTLIRKLGFKGLRPHDLRHTCATWIYEATGDLLAVKEHLHHSDLKTSLRYTHTKKDDQLEKLNKAFTPKLRVVK